MKFLISGSMPIEAGNRMAKSGKLGSTIQSVLEAIKPEAVYFGLKNGQRAMFLIVEMTDASQIPSVAEPLFLTFNGSLDIMPVMTPQDLAKAGPSIEAAVKKFGS